MSKIVEEVLAANREYGKEIPEATRMGKAS